MAVAVLMLMSGSLSAEGSTAARLPNDVTAVVEHNTPQIRPEETAAFYRAVAIARAGDYREQQDLASQWRQKRHAVSKHADRPLEEFPGFVDLFLDYEAYNGRPVTWSGHTRLVRKYPTVDNEQNIDRLYEVWMFPDGSQSNPAVVYCTSIPDDMPIGDNIAEQVTATGYFFKMSTYEARDTVRRAPVMVASRIEWQPRESFAAAEPSTWWLVAAATLCLLIVAGFAWANRRSAARLRRQRRQAADEELPDFSRLDPEER